jgi:hypothetical protein
MAVRQDRKTLGWRVELSFTPGMDELWESIQHFALFECKDEAEALQARIRKAGQLDLDYWLWSPSRCTPFGQLQEAPTAKNETTPRPRTRF